MKLVRDKKNPLHILGRSLVAILLGIMITIATASSIGVLPVIYWALLGIGVAYGQIIKQQNTVVN